jgi:D-amino peptidase
MTLSGLRSVCNMLFVGFVLAVSPNIARLDFAQAPADSGKKLKVYISVDMEGVAGVVTPDQLGPGGFEYERFRHFMTDETLAAVRAAKEAGAGEIVVSDSHGNGENLLIEEFPKDVRIVRAWPRHGGMMAGLDSSFSAAMFIGYHASTTNPNGVRYISF